MSNEKKEYFKKQWGHEGYTMEEARNRLKKLKKELFTGKTAYTNIEIEGDPRGGYRIVATYRAGIHYYGENGDIDYTTPIDR